MRSQKIDLALYRSSELPATCQLSGNAPSSILMGNLYV